MYRLPQDVPSWISPEYSGGSSGSTNRWIGPQFDTAGIQGGSYGDPVLVPTGNYGNAVMLPTNTQQTGNTATSTIPNPAPIPVTSDPLSSFVQFLKDNPHMAIIGAGVIGYLLFIKK